MPDAARWVVVVNLRTIDAVYLSEYYYNRYSALLHVFRKLFPTMIPLSLQQLVVFHFRPAYDAECSFQFYSAA